MPRITPCYRCPLREGCERKAELAKRCKGLGAVSVKFSCGKLSAELRPGRRIVITAPKMGSGLSEGEGEEWKIGTMEVRATITKVAGSHRFRCTADPGQFGEDNEWVSEKLLDGEKFRFRRPQAHYRIVRFLDEPDSEVCKLGNVQRDGACDCPRDSAEALCWCAIEERHERAQAAIRARW